MKQYRILVLLVCNFTYNSQPIAPSTPVASATFQGFSAEYIESIQNAQKAEIAARTQPLIANLLSGNKQYAVAAVLEMATHTSSNPELGNKLSHLIGGATNHLLSFMANYEDAPVGLKWKIMSYLTAGINGITWGLNKISLGLTPKTNIELPKYVGFWISTFLKILTKNPTKPETFEPIENHLNEIIKVLRSTMNIVANPMKDESSIAFMHEMDQNIAKPLQALKLDSVKAHIDATVRPFLFFLTHHDLIKTINESHNTQEENRIASIETSLENMRAYNADHPNTPENPYNQIDTSIFDDYATNPNTSAAWDLLFKVNKAMPMIKKAKKYTDKVYNIKAFFDKIGGYFNKKQYHNPDKDIFQDGDELIESIQSSRLVGTAFKSLGYLSTAAQVVGTGIQIVKGVGLLIENGKYYLEKGGKILAEGASAIKAYCTSNNINTDPEPTPPDKPITYSQAYKKMHDSLSELLEGQSVRDFLIKMITRAPLDANFVLPTPDQITSQWNDVKNSATSDHLPVELVSRLLTLAVKVNDDTLEPEEQLALNKRRIAATLLFDHLLNKEEKTGKILLITEDDENKMIDDLVAKIESKIAEKEGELSTLSKGIKNIKKFIFGSDPIEEFSDYISNNTISSLIDDTIPQETIPVSDIQRPIQPLNTPATILDHLNEQYDLVHSDVPLTAEQPASQALRILNIADPKIGRFVEGLLDLTALDKITLDNTTLQRGTAAVGVKSDATIRIIQTFSNIINTIPQAESHHMDSIKTLIQKVNDIAQLRQQEELMKLAQQNDDNTSNSRQAINAILNDPAYSWDKKLELVNGQLAKVSSDDLMTDSTYHTSLQYYLDFPTHTKTTCFLLEHFKNLSYLNKDHASFSEEDIAHSLVSTSGNSLTLQEARLMVTPLRNIYGAIETFKTVKKDISLLSRLKTSLLRLIKRKTRNPEAFLLKDGNELNTCMNKVILTPASIPIKPLDDDNQEYYDTHTLPTDMIRIIQGFSNNNQRKSIQQILKLQKDSHVDPLAKALNEALQSENPLDAEDDIGLVLQSFNDKNDTPIDFATRALAAFHIANLLKNQISSLDDDTFLQLVQETVLLVNKDGIKNVGDIQKTLEAQSSTILDFVQKAATQANDLDYPGNPGDPSDPEDPLSNPIEDYPLQKTPLGDNPTHYGSTGSLYDDALTPEQLKAEAAREEAAREEAVREAAQAKATQEAHERQLREMNINKGNVEQLKQHFEHSGGGI